MKKVVALTLLVCAFSLPALAGNIHTGRVNVHPGISCTPSSDNCDLDDNGNYNPFAIPDARIGETKEKESDIFGDFINQGLSKIADIFAF